MAGSPFVTQIVPPTLDADTMPAPTLAERVRLRAMSAEDWIARHASGTLRKNAGEDFAWRDQYLHERTAFEFGWGFEALPASRVLLGRPYTEGDCKALTEAGWHIERYRSLRFFPEDEFLAAYVRADDGGGRGREGVGIFVARTSAAWIGRGMVAFALVAPWDPAAGAWGAAQNPF